MKEIVRPIALAAGMEGEAVFGRMFIVRFATALKLSAIHKSGNDAVKKPIEEVWHSIAHGKDLWIKIAAGRFFINSEYVNINYNTLPHAEELRNIFEKCEISEMHFEANMKLETLRAFFDQYQERMRTGSPEGLRLVSVPGVTLIPSDNAQEKQRTVLKSETSCEKIIDSYARLCVGIRFMSSQLKESENPQYAILRHELQNIWTYAEEDRDFVIGITQKMAAEGKVEHYATNVVILTLLMAQELKLSRTLALHLGVQALTQDLDRLVTPEFREEQKVFETTHLIQELKKVPLSTLKTILSRGADAKSTHRLVCAFESQVGAAYKKGEMEGVVSWAGRFIAVPATFMRLTMPMHRQPLPHDRAAQILISHSSESLEQVFVAAFFRVMGIYPVGTYVALSDDRMGIVMRSALQVNMFDQPTVKLIKPSRVDEMGDVIDLSQTELRVLRSLPFKGVVATSDFLLA